MSKIESSAINKRIINILSNDDLDFIAYIITPFHALGVDAFVYDLFKKYGCKLEGLVIILEHDRSGFVTNETHFKCSTFANIRFLYVQKPSFSEKKGSFKLVKIVSEILIGFLKVKINTFYRKKDLYVISVMSTPISLFRLFDDRKVISKYSPKFVKIDEGLGTYMDKDFWKLTRRYDLNGMESSRTHLEKIRIICISKTSNVVKYFINNCFKIESRLIFIQKSQSLLPNKLSINAYKAILGLNNNDIPEIIYPLIRKKWIIFASQAFVDYGQINAADYLSILKEIISVLTEKNYNVALKPHPRESVNLYKSIINEKKNVFILPKSLTLENLLQFHPHATIGFTSTALVTSNLFYDVPSISIIEMLLKATDDPLLTITAKQFKLKFEKFVYLADSIDKFNKSLDIIIENINTGS